MTGLHDRDRMKSGKALVTEYIADASAVCNVSFLKNVLKNLIKHGFFAIQNISVVKCAFFQESYY